MISEALRWGRSSQLAGSPSSRGGAGPASSRKGEAHLGGCTASQRGRRRRLARLANRIEDLGRDCRAEASPQPPRPFLRLTGSERRRQRPGVWRTGGKGASRVRRPTRARPCNRTLSHVGVTDTFGRPVCDMVRPRAASVARREGEGLSANAGGPVAALSPRLPCPRQQHQFASRVRDPRQSAFQKT